MANAMKMTPHLIPKDGWFLTTKTTPVGRDGNGGEVALTDAEIRTAVPGEARMPPGTVIGPVAATDKDGRRWTCHAILTGIVDPEPGLPFTRLTALVTGKPEPTPPKKPTDISVRGRLNHAREVAPVGSFWRNDRGQTFAVVGHCVYIRMVVPVVLYARGNGMVWCAPLYEFEDGTFARMDDAEGELPNGTRLSMIAHTKTEGER